ncbi:hypothetical protein [Intestinibacter bartlettii]|uniref:BRCT domain-containing protein n=1 Tax=Intestinibacter bartlettii CAG:1329 TaxID=1263063 RepID=R5Y3G0_9FIRM|nr:hypothetical protein [Intestinibacter bartlettii]CDA11212.1 putative uncharacterized protein [Intestinibacter bartlettii CAG:1329]
MNEIIKKKILELNKVKNNIEQEYEYELDRINQIINIISSFDINQTDNVDEIVFNLYILLNSVKKVADYINEIGYRIETTSKQGKRKYNSNDITAIIKNKDAMVNNEIKTIAQEIQMLNYKNVSKRWF